MGEGESGLDRHDDRTTSRAGNLTMPRQATVGELEDWEQGGATWRALELSKDRAIVELCTCFGETVDVVESDDPQFIHFVRTHPVD